MSRRTIAQVLADAQGRLRRLSPREAQAAVREGWTLVDTRSAEAIAEDGAIPGAVQIPLSVLEWRVDPASQTHSPALAGHEDRLVLICEDGYSSSLAAIRLHELGFADTTDVIGGFVAWLAAGLPIAPRAPRRRARGAIAGSSPRASSRARAARGGAPLRRKT
ncbi:MAG: rhodanese-like domain-containing protein [Chloroflexi bacterium]|nr:MAG: rhodanese-like domain-containing protein [Chloroflexota bacterium]